MQMNQLAACLIGINSQMACIKLFTKQETKRAKKIAMIHISWHAWCIGCSKEGPGEAIEAGVRVFVALEQG